MTVSPTDGYLIYKDYYYCGNTKGTTQAEINDIEREYSRYLSDWQAKIAEESQDTNIENIDLDDEMYSQYLKNGENVGKDATKGYTAKDGAGDTVQACGDLLASGLSATYALGGAKVAGKAVEEGSKVFLK